MSRIGKRPVPVPKGVTASVSGQKVTVKGPKGELSLVLVNEVRPEMTADGVSVTTEIVDADDPRGAARWLQVAMREAWATRPLLREAMAS